MYCIYKKCTQSLFGYVSPGDCVFLVVSLFLLTNHCSHRRIRVHWYTEKIYMSMYAYIGIYSMSVSPSTGSCQQSWLSLSLNDPQLADHRSMVNDRWFGSLWFASLELTQVKSSQVESSWVELSELWSIGLIISIVQHFLQIMCIICAVIEAETGSLLSTSGVF